MTVQVRKLKASDDRSEFRSGNVDLDRFFAQYAGQNQFRHHLGTTYVAVVDELIAGYATVTASEILPSMMPAMTRKRPARYPVPVLRLARLAVDERTRSQGVGDTLMRPVFTLAHGMADQFGCVGVLVDAKPDAIAFYRRFGFMVIDMVTGPLGDRPQPTPMLLGLAEIPAAK